MNRTKRNLILASSIILFISVAMLLFSMVFFIRVSNSALQNMLSDYGEVFVGNIDAARTTLVVTTAVGFAFELIAAITLICSIREGGSKFASSRGLFLTGLVFAIITGPISIQSILLYVAVGIKDAESYRPEFNAVNPMINDQFIEQTTQSKDQIKQTIMKYQTLKNQGLISDEEYKKIIIKYLRELKNKGSITQEQFENLLTRLI